MRTAHIILHTAGMAIVWAAFVVAVFVWAGVLTGRI